MKKIIELLNDSNNVKKVMEGYEFDLIPYVLYEYKHPFFKTYIKLLDVELRINNREVKLWHNIWHFIENLDL